MGEGSGGTGGWTMRGQKRAGGGSMHSLSTWKKQRRVSEGTRNVFQRRIQCFVGVVGVVVGVLAAHCCEVGESRVLPVQQRRRRGKANVTTDRNETTFLFKAFDGPATAATGSRYESHLVI